MGSVYAYWNEHGHLPPPEELGFYLIDGNGQSYMPDSGERYLSKLNPEWMKEKGLLGADEGLS